MVKNRLLTVQQAADRLELFEDQIIAWLNTGDLPYTEESGRKLISLPELYRFMQRHPRTYAKDMNQALRRRRLEVISTLNPDEDELLGVKQVAAYLETSKSHVYKMLKELRQLPYVKKGRQYFVRKGDLEAYTERNRRAYAEFLAWRKEQGMPPEDLVDARQLHEDMMIWLEEREGPER